MKEIFKIKLLLILLLFVNCGSSAQISNNKNAIKYYEKQLAIIENSRNSQLIDSNNLLKAIDILETITSINSYSEISDYGSYKAPVSYNINDWNLWLQTNKNSLEFDKITRKLFIKNAIPLKKEPNLLFEKYISNLRTMQQSANYNVEEINYASDMLESLTGINIIFNNECDCRYPSSEDFQKLDNWYKKNKNNLTWNSLTQKIELKN